MSSTSMSERILKLKQLQKKKAEGAKQNREELFKEHRIQKIGEGKLRSMEEKKEKALEELEKIDSKEKGEDWDRKKAWDYSMEDHEKWDAKLEDKQANVKNAGFINYSQLAEQSYKKEISLLNLDNDQHLKAKEKKNGKGRTSNKDGTKNTDEIDYNNKPSKEAIERLVSGMKSSDIRKAKRRNDYENTDNYSKYQKRNNSTSRP